MKVALVGSSGYISGFLIKKFQSASEIKEIVRIDKVGETDACLDLEKADEFSYAVLDGVDFVVFTAAISSPDKCASEPEYCERINVTGTGYFIGEALRRGCRVLFFSSDAVYGEDTGTIFTEESPTAPKTPYGHMKKAIEDRFLGNENFKAIRLSYVVSAKDRFVSYCLDCMAKGVTAEVYHPFYRNCVSVHDVVNVVSWLILHWEEYRPGLLNVAGEELVSRVRIADEINRIAKDRLRYTIVKPKDSFYSNRPAITQMRSLYLGKYGILTNNSFTEKIRLELEDIVNDESVDHRNNGNGRFTSG